MEKNTSPPSLQDINGTKASYAGIFPESFKTINIYLALPIGTDSVEQSFSNLKMIKTRLLSRLSGVAQFLRISIEGLQIYAV